MARFQPLTTDTWSRPHNEAAFTRRKDEALENFEDLASEPRRMLAQIEGIIRLCKEGVFADRAWAYDLAKQLEAAVHDADAFNAIKLGDGGDVDEASDLLSKAAE